MGRPSNQQVERTEHDEEQPGDLEQQERRPLLQQQQSASPSTASPLDDAKPDANPRGSDQLPSSRPAPAPAGSKPLKVATPTKAAAAAAAPAGHTLLASEGSGGTPAGCGVCRICLEDEPLEGLEAPCACTGTQRHAHHACIQKWVNEKHTLRCEICDTDYKGSYTVPPLPPPLSPDNLPLVTPLGSLYVTIAAEGEGGGARGVLLSADPWADDEEDETPPAMSWCASLLVFLLFMLVLHHSVVLNVPGDTPGAPGGVPTGPGAAATLPGGPGTGFIPDASGGGLVPSPGFGPGGAPSGQGLPSPGTALAAGLSLFLLWALTKIMLVAVPLATLMRLAARHQEEDDLEGGGLAAGGAASSAGSASGAAERRQQARLQQQLLMLARLRRYMQMAEAANGGGDNRGTSGRPRLPGVV